MIMMIIIIIIARRYRYYEAGSLNWPFSIIACVCACAFFFRIGNEMTVIETWNVCVVCTRFVLKQQAARIIYTSYRFIFDDLFRILMRYLLAHFKSLSQSIALSDSPLFWLHTIERICPTNDSHIHTHTH